MRIAANLRHANLSALDSVLEEIRQAKVDCVVIGGDVFPGPLPLETIQCLVDIDIPGAVHPRQRRPRGASADVRFRDGLVAYCIGTVAGAGPVDRATTRSLTA